MSFAAAAFVSAIALWGSERPAAALTPEEVFTYSGADRQKVLEEGAKKEGAILWYTTMILDQRARPIANVFMKKYPFINVQIVQIDSGPMIPRVLGEFNAKKFDLDIVEGSYPVLLSLKKGGALAKFSSPALSAIPKGALDPQGYFFGDREIPQGFAYNTSAVPQDKVPKSAKDLLDPFWKGKLSTNDSVQGMNYFGALSVLYGDSYAKELSKHGVTVYSNMSSNAVTDLVASGVAIATFPTSVGQVVASQRKGAPIAWTSLGPAVTTVGMVGLLANAPHPHAAALFADFLASEEGQLTLVKTGEGGTRIGIANDYGGYQFEKNYFESTVPQDSYMDSVKDWAGYFKTLFAK